MMIWLLSRYGGDVWGLQLIAEYTAWLTSVQRYQGKKWWCGSKLLMWWWRWWWRWCQEWLEMCLDWVSPQFQSDLWLWSFVRSSWCTMEMRCIYWVLVMFGFRVSDILCLALMYCDCCRRGVWFWMWDCKLALLKWQSVIQPAACCLIWIMGMMVMMMMVMISWLLFWSESVTTITITITITIDECVC